jgi:hypothetical protein
MKTILRISKFVTYVAQCFQAVAKGVEAVATAWPTDSPFANSNPVPNEVHETK